MVQNYTLCIEGMTCEGCAASVKRVLTALPGVEAVDVDFAASKARVRADVVSMAPLVAAIERAGFDVVDAP